MRATRVLRQPAAAAIAPQPQDEVDVLQVGEDPLVEAPEREERLAVEGGRRSRWADGVGDRPSRTLSGSPFR